MLLQLLLLLVVLLLLLLVRWRCKGPSSGRWAVSTQQRAAEGIGGIWVGTPAEWNSMIACNCM
jgi:hypothetical protein